ncbi:MAG: agmatine/peptidylarginine deiminase [Geoalkalibacter sp.]|jgi:agmatine deiminase|uniref:agmatine deiminase family protein n=1 Tax=Geoalkalibacter sp. TaxID=3041440 RepID=UPI002A923FF5|nr:agmatine deiminase family protein [Thermodesulfobacteriota bacterium]
MTLRLPAEWEDQDGVLLAWPHEQTDWAPVLDRVVPVFRDLACAISRHEKVLIVTPAPDLVFNALGDVQVNRDRIRVLEIPTNDTWARDFGPITIYRDNRPVLLDFGFNGWGLKFPSNFDNQVTRNLVRAGTFGETALHTSGLILEGGSIESDGCGTLLTTGACLLEPNRNPHLDRHGIEAALSANLGVDHILWLENGYLEGDDTDSHIDTLARLCPDGTIAYVTCDDETDPHYEELRRMEEELSGLRTRDGRPFHLIPLPWPRPRFDDGGQRLPATYANFLVINNAVLVPTYNDPRDKEALTRIAEAFAGRKIIGIDCSPLILQHGSLHCVTMQLPKGVLP